MKSRIGLGISASRLIFAPVVTLAIYYIAGMVSAAKHIATVDVDVARLADESITEIAEIRKAEKDFLLLKDPAYLKKIDANSQALFHRIENMMALDPSRKALFVQINDVLREYRDGIDQLSQSSPPVSDGQGREQFVGLVDGYRDRIDKMLEAAKQSRTPDEISRSIVEINNGTMPFDQYVVQASVGAQPQRTRILSNMQSRGEQLESLAKSISDSSWNKVEEERNRTEALGHRASVLITITLALTLIVSFLFTWLLPRRVMRPLNQVTEALRKASRGNYDVFLHLSAKDEVGELVNEFHNLIEHMRDRDNGKDNGKSLPPNNTAADVEAKKIPSFTIF